jgi:hypothetical protein
VRRARPGDRFRVFGFTREDVISGQAFGIMRLPMIALRNMVELNEQFGPLAVAERLHKVAKEEGQVYVSPISSDGTKSVYDKLDGQFQLIYFLNDTAFRLCAENQITLPPAIHETARAYLPHGLAVAARFPHYIRVAPVADTSTRQNSRARIRKPRRRD